MAQGSISAPIPHSHASHALRLAPPRPCCYASGAHWLQAISSSVASHTHTDPAQHRRCACAHEATHARYLVACTGGPQPINLNLKSEPSSKACPTYQSIRLHTANPHLVLAALIHAACVARTWAIKPKSAAPVPEMTARMCRQLVLTHFVTDCI